MSKRSIAHLHLAQEVLHPLVQLPRRSAALFRRCHAPFGALLTASFAAGCAHTEDGGSELRIAARQEMRPHVDRAVEVGRLAGGHGGDVGLDHCLPARPQGLQEELPVAEGRGQ